PSVARRARVRHANRVVLPAPLGPMIARRCPMGIRIETPSTAWMPPKALRRSATSIAGDAVASGDTAEITAVGFREPLACGLLLSQKCPPPAAGLEPPCAAGTPAGRRTARASPAPARAGRAAPTAR